VGAGLVSDTEVELAVDEGLSVVLLPEQPATMLKTIMIVSIIPKKRISFFILIPLF
jgi:hypothetical protein